MPPSLYIRLPDVIPYSPLFFLFVSPFFYLNTVRYTINCSGSAYSGLKEKVAGQTSEEPTEQVGTKIGTEDSTDSITLKIIVTHLHQRYLPPSELNSSSPPTDNPPRDNLIATSSFPGSILPCFFPISTWQGNVLSSLSVEFLEEITYDPSRPRTWYPEIPFSKFHHLLPVTESIEPGTIVFEPSRIWFK